MDFWGHDGNEERNVFTQILRGGSEQIYVVVFQRVIRERKKKVGTFLWAQESSFPTVQGCTSLSALLWKGCGLWCKIKSLRLFQACAFLAV